ncbi:phage terminase small subunit P27 family [Algoriphagus sp. D3-2-R+10]|uniref:phage terminase small subunit P27 family n=1 Tax=Algoriphagus aurantiacus TaxID=3103948 RepID=UPI002B37D14B|nr:phage terminase small subunit P27 family [Algoriphagus sp. D3-2-R+10]MEB2775221.1 phage terminase small subunit P27 family [Algoriphagus sp. D3-2-R+10]
MIPNEIKQLNGTYRADRDKNKDVKFDSIESMKVPVFLKGESRKNFKLLVDQLGINGYDVLTSLDAPALTLLADVYGEYITVTKTIESEGLIIEDYNNRGKLVKKLSPLASYKRMLFNDIARLLKEFGMTPSSRNKVEFKPANESKEDEFNF